MRSVNSLIGVGLALAVETKNVMPFATSASQFVLLVKKRASGLASTVLAKMLAIA